MTPGNTFGYEQRISVFKGHNIIKIVPLKFIILSYHIMKLVTKYCPLDKNDQGCAVFNGDIVCLFVCVCVCVCLFKYVYS